MEKFEQRQVAAEEGGGEQPAEADTTIAAASGESVSAGFRADDHAAPGFGVLTASPPAGDPVSEAVETDMPHRAIDMAAEKFRRSGSELACEEAVGSPA